MKSYPVQTETLYFYTAIEFDGHYYTVTVDPKDPNLDEHHTTRRFDDFQSAHKVFADIFAELMRIEIAAMENPADLKHIEWVINRDHADACDLQQSHNDPEIARLIAEQG